jgi:hypothetical protein
MIFGGTATAAITGGKISAEDGIAISNTGTVTINGGKISAENGVAISNIVFDGTITITDGIISAGTTGNAVHGVMSANRTIIHEPPTVITAGGNTGREGTITGFVTWR